MPSTIAPPPHGAPQQQQPNRAWLGDGNVLEFVEDGAPRSVDWLAPAREADGDTDAMPLLRNYLDSTGVLCHGVEDAAVTALEVDPDDDYSGRRRRFKISDDRPDRSRNVIKLDGWDLRPFNHNPVVLWAHSSWDVPIGQALETRVEDGALYSVGEFERFDFAQLILELLDRKTLRAASVGMLPREMSFDKQRGGVNFIRHELLEWSVVPIPRNPRALVAAAADGVELAPLRRWCLDILDGVGGEPGRWVPEERLKATVDHLGWAGGVAMYDLSASQIRDLSPQDLERARVAAARLPASEGSRDEIAADYRAWGAEPPWKAQAEAWARYEAACARVEAPDTAQLVGLLTAAGFAAEAEALESAGDPSTETSTMPPNEASNDGASTSSSTDDQADSSCDGASLEINAEAVALAVGNQISKLARGYTAATGRAVIPD